MKASIDLGYESAIKDPAMAKAFRKGKPTIPQMVLWMNEVSEIAILDYIFNQQDRIGNIDFIWYWIERRATRKLEEDLIKENNVLKAKLYDFQQDKGLPPSKAV